MTNKNWREDLDLVIDENLNDLIKATKHYDSAIRKSKDPAKAQMWVAMALLNAKLNNITVNKKAHENKIPQEELNNIIKTLEQL
jgi:hypothetical protein